jgi:hypothetical protein
MNKLWKTKTCETCENQVSRYCRLNPPKNLFIPAIELAQYPRVGKTFIDSRLNIYQSACSQYEEMS